MAEQQNLCHLCLQRHGMAEFTLRDLVIGLIVSDHSRGSKCLSGIEAGMTIAATYPAASLGWLFSEL